MRAATESDDSISLYVSRGETASYACLSYCWGDALPLRTTQSAYRDRQDGIMFHHLPRTLQDAVIVTRALGIKYLWIDARTVERTGKPSPAIGRPSTKMLTMSLPLISPAIVIAGSCLGNHGARQSGSLLKFPTRTTTQVISSMGERYESMGTRRAISNVSQQDRFDRLVKEHGLSKRRC